MVSCFYSRSHAMDILGSALGSPKLQEWEVRDQRTKTQLNTAIASANPQNGNNYSILSIHTCTCIHIHK